MYSIKIQGYGVLDKRELMDDAAALAQMHSTRTPGVIVGIYEGEVEVPDRIYLSGERYDHYEA